MKKLRQQTIFNDKGAHDPVVTFGDPAALTNVAASYAFKELSFFDLAPHETAASC